MRHPRIARCAAAALAFATLIGMMCGAQPASAVPPPFSVGPVALYAGGPQGEAHFGQAVAVSGDTIVVGEPDHEEPVIGALPLDCGAAYVYVRDSATGAWALQQTLLPHQIRSGAQFGQAVAIDGDTLVVGAPGMTTGDGTTGLVYIFHRTGTTWTFSVNMSIEGAAEGDRIGAAVSIDATTVVAGAPGDNSGRGAAWVFDYDGVSWDTEAVLTDPVGAAGDGLGGSVDVDGDTVMAGATGDDWGMTNAVSNVGSVAWFSRSGGVWTYRNTLRPPDPTADSGFGGSIALSNGRLLVGAMTKTVNGLAGAGKAYVFGSDGATWGLETSMTAPTPAADSLYGSSVALDGPTALVGEFFANGYRGKAYFYTGLSGVWTMRQTIDMEGESPSVTQLGTSAGLSGGTAVLGAQMSSSPTVALSGAAFVFETHGTISGVVRDAATHLPVAGIEVSAYPAGQVEPDVLAGLTNTDALGRYSFSLDAGGYAIGWMDQSQTYYPGFYNDVNVYPDSTPVSVTASATTTLNLLIHAKPKVTLTTPSVPTWAAHGHKFTAYGYLKPRHAVGSYPVKLQCYRYEKLRTGHYGYVLRKTVSAKAYNYHPRVGRTYTKYSVRLSLPYKGKWRIRAYHAPDSTYAPTYSGYHYITIR
jgi:hypothetical protein